MGTRARVEIFDGPSCIVSIYRQFDGYPEGLGRELVEFLKPLTITNGIGAKKDNTANGIGCLAAQLVARLKDRVGNVYLQAPMTKDGECGEEFIYRLLGESGKTGLAVQVTAGDVTAFGFPNDPGSFKGMFSGSVEEFAAWCTQEE